MKTALRSGVVAAVVVAMAALPVHAAGDSVDQSVTLVQGMNSFLDMTPMAEVFTAGQDGSFDQVSLYAGTPCCGTTFYIDIATATGGKPSTHYLTDGTNLSTTKEPGSLPISLTWNNFPLSKAAPVARGQQYAIIVRSLNHYFRWGFVSNYLYPGGQMLMGPSWAPAPANYHFDFKEWVASNANTPPTVTPASDGTTVDEGTAPQMTGTFFDPDLDTVKLTASSGSVTQSGSSTGTWTWTAPATDEATAQTVTITADDGQGFKTSAQFSVTVMGVDPTAQITGAPVSSPEGTPVSLTGTATSPDAADNAAPFAYSWSVTKDGSPFTGGFGASFGFTPNDEGSYVVTLTATDDGGMPGTTSLTVVGLNVPPVARISGYSSPTSLVLLPQQTVTFAGSFTAPNAPDQHTVTWNYGDGQSLTRTYGPGGATLSASHRYSAAGTYTVTLTVSDGEGGVGEASTRVTVQSPQQALNAIAAYVQRLTSLNNGQKQSLIAKLNAAAAAAARGDSNAAENQLDAFLNELEADANTGKVLAGDAETLRSNVSAVQAALGTINRFLEWWPLEA